MNVTIRPITYHRQRLWQVAVTGQRVATFANRSTAIAFGCVFLTFERAKPKITLVLWNAPPTPKRKRTRRPARNQFGPLRPRSASHRSIEVLENPHATPDVPVESTEAKETPEGQTLRSACRALRYAPPPIPGRLRSRPRRLAPGRFGDPQALPVTRPRMASLTPRPTRGRDLLRGPGARWGGRLKA
jgi:hypothetical protein